jgi:sugar/nucleoside kinase (ribokinase family)
MVDRVGSPPESTKGEGPAVFGFGSAAVDFRIQTADLGPDYREKLLAQQVSPLGGGAVANFLVQVSRLGGRAAWLGKIGDDWIGRTMVQELESEGVGCRGVIADKETCSPFNLAVYAGNQRRRVGGFLLPNSLASVSNTDITHFAGLVAPGDYVMIEVGEIPLQICRGFAQACAEKGARIVIDVDLDPIVQCRGSRADIDALLAGADLIMPNCSAMTTLYPDLSPAALAERLVSDFGRLVVVSAGEEGAFSATPDSGVSHHKALEIEAVDTVGAGDAFHGGVVFALATGLSLDDAVMLGARCGAANCESFGARQGMPTAAQLGLT